MSAPQTRREFLKTTAAAAAVTSAAPLFLHAADKAGSKTPVVGEGEHTYEVQHGWGQLPSHIAWGDTHGVCVDKQGLVYIKHRSPRREPMDAIAVFDPKGKFVRSFGKEWHGGGHGIDLRVEDGQEFLYLSCIGLKTVAKCDLKGEVVWKKGVPTECGKYDTKNPKYSPTNVAFSPDGGYYIGDGYGSSYIHQYDPKGEWVRTWGGFGDAPGKMKTPHGLWLDDRPGRMPSLAVADRANARLQYFTLDGEHIGFVNEVSFPAHFDIRGDVLLCPDLHARVTLFDKDNKVITHLGYEPAWTEQVLADGLALRRDPKKYRPGRFVHPHDACFDHAGNIIVVEWVPQGRVSFLKKVS